MQKLIRNAFLGSQHFSWTAAFFGLTTLAIFLNPSITRADTFYLDGSADCAQSGGCVSPEQSIWFKVGLDKATYTPGETIRATGNNFTDYGSYSAPVYLWAQIQNVSSQKTVLNNVSVDSGGSADFVAPESPGSYVMVFTGESDVFYLFEVGGCHGGESDQCFGNPEGYLVHAVGSHSIPFTVVPVAAKCPNGDSAPGGSTAACTCAQGNASACPQEDPPPPVASIGHLCSADATSVVISWTASPGAIFYDPRIWINDSACPTGWSPALDAGGVWNGHSCYIDNITGTSISFATTPGKTYAAWVFPGNAAGVNWSTPPSTGDFSCQAPLIVQTCPDGSAAPQNDPGRCTCAQGNTNACTSTPGTCQGGSTPVNGQCPGGGGGCSDPNNCSAPPPPGPGCNIAASPRSAAPGSQVLLGWASACDSAAAGCTTSVLGISFPVVAGNTRIDQGVGVVSPSSGQNPILVTPLSLPITYMLSGSLSSGYWPLLIPLPGSDYSCTVAVQSTGTPRNPSICTQNAATCSPNGSKILTTFSDPDQCPDQEQPCPYYTLGGLYACHPDQFDKPLCLIPPPPTAEFRVQPTLVRSGTKVHVSLTAHDVERCTIASSASLPDGRNLPGTRGHDWIVSDDYYSHDGITGQTIFTLHCDGILHGTSIDKVVTVNLVPQVIER